MAIQRLGIIMHGVTGRMGMNQHLIRSIVAIREQGGVQLANGDKVMPDPIFSNFRVQSKSGLAYAVEVRDVRQRQFTGLAHVQEDKILTCFQLARHLGGVDLREEICHGPFYPL